MLVHTTKVYIGLEMTTTAIKKYGKSIHLQEAGVNSALTMSQKVPC